MKKLTKISSPSSELNDLLVPSQEETINPSSTISALPASSAPLSLVEPASRLPAATSGPTGLELARQLIPKAVRDRKVRAGSFLASLTAQQRSLVIQWLAKESVSDVERRIALPPPNGLGMEVCYTTLWRLKNGFDNINLTSWLDDAMDAACDTLDSDSAADAAPLRETISLLLHSHAIHQLRHEAPVDEIDKTLAAITKIEKLRATANAHPRNPSQKLKLDVTVSAAKRPATESAPPIEVKLVPTDGSDAPEHSVNVPRTNGISSATAE